MGHQNGDRATYSHYLEEFLKDSKEFHEAFPIAKGNSQRGGRIWLIGSFGYRPIIRVVHGLIREPNIIDIDFLMEGTRKTESLYVPQGWEPHISEDYGNPYLLKEDGRVRIDLNYMKSFHPIIARKLNPRIRHFYPTTPTDLQSMTYDLTDRKIGLRGWRGIEAIKRKVVRINNLEEANFVAERRGISIDKLVKEKADELGFGYNLAPMISIEYPHIIKKLAILEDKDSEKKKD